MGYGKYCGFEERARLKIVTLLLSDTMTSLEYKEGTDVPQELDRHLCKRVSAVYRLPLSGT